MTDPCGQPPTSQGAVFDMRSAIQTLCVREVRYSRTQLMRYGEMCRKRRECNDGFGSDAAESIGEVYGAKRAREGASGGCLVCAMPLLDAATSFHQAAYEVGKKEVGSKTASKSDLTRVEGAQSQFMFDSAYNNRFQETACEMCDGYRAV